MVPRKTCLTLHIQLNNGVHCGVSDGVALLRFGGWKKDIATTDDRAWIALAGVGVPIGQRPSSMLFS